MIASTQTVRWLSAVSLALWLPLSPSTIGAEPPAEFRVAEVSDADRARIEEALPSRAPARPAKPRKLLIFDLNVGYPGHPSIAHANLAFTRMGETTGAFQAVVRRDPEVFRRESLEQFDAVFLNNTVGNLFEDPELRRNLVEFVCGGGGLLGVHGATVAFTRWPGAHEDWPEFGRMLGGRGARHRESDEHVFVKLDDPDHPLNRPFAGGFEYRDEFFRVGDPYSRSRVRVLFSIDTERTRLDAADGRWQPERADGDYALAWVRNYGKGRVFYCTIAHNPRVFHDPRMLELYLGAIQFALGDLAAPSLPSAKLTTAEAAREKLGWRLGVTAYSFHKYTLFEAIDKTAELGLSYIGGLSFQKVSDEIPKNLEPGLSDEEMERVRLKLDDKGVRMVTYYFHRIPGDEAGCRRVFELGRKLGIETFLSEPEPESLDTIERFCEEYDIAVALHNHGPDTSPHYWSPAGILKACDGRSRRIGACADLGYWMRSGVDPIEAVRVLGDRLITLQVHDLHEAGSEGHDVPWGTGIGQTETLVEEVYRLGLRPTLFGLEYSHDWLDSMPEMAESAAFFDRVCTRLADEEDGFVPLFAGDGTPEGWLVRRWNDVSQPADPGVEWTVRDGVLHGSPSRGTWLISERDYEDFELRYEFKLGPLGNSGCALRAPPAGDPAFDGMELQMADFRYNTGAKDSELTGGIYRAIAPRRQVYRPTEWNRVRIRLEGGRLHVVLNGVLLHDVDLKEQTQEVSRHDGTLAPPIQDRPRRGRIGFQELSRGDERVQIRDARIKVLDPGPESIPTRRL